MEGHDVCCSWRTSRGMNLSLTYNIKERYKLLDGNVNKVPLAKNIIAETYINQLPFENKFVLIAAICGWIPDRLLNFNFLN